MKTHIQIIDSLFRFCVLRNAFVVVAVIYAGHSFVGIGSISTMRFLGSFFYRGRVTKSLRLVAIGLLAVFGIDFVFHAAFDPSHLGFATPRRNRCIVPAFSSCCTFGSLHLPIMNPYR